MFNAGSHTPEFYSGNMIEQKNSRVKVLKALVSRENQPRMMSTFRDDVNFSLLAKIFYRWQGCNKSNRLKEKRID
jgi:hypothetical protein